MKRTGRWRKRAKWAGAAACAVILAAWGVSLRFFVFIPLGRRGYAMALSGVFSMVEYSANSNPPNFDFSITGRPWAWKGYGFEWPRLFLPPHANASVPFWFLLLAATIPTAYLFKRDRRKILPGCCKQCGYDLRSMSDGRCPECGMAVGSEGHGAGNDEPAEKMVQAAGVIGGRPSISPPAKDR